MQHAATDSRHARIGVRPGEGDGTRAGLGEFTAGTLYRTLIVAAPEVALADGQGDGTADADHAAGSGEVADGQIFVIHVQRSVRIDGELVGGGAKHIIVSHFGGTRIDDGSARIGVAVGGDINVHEACFRSTVDDGGGADRQRARACDVFLHVERGVGGRGDDTAIGTEGDFAVTEGGHGPAG